MRTTHRINLAISLDVCSMSVHTLKDKKTACTECPI